MAEAAGLDDAREALARRSWAEAYERLGDIDPSTLAPSDLEGLADAAWWLSRIDESIAARQKAYSAFSAAADETAAGAVAVRLCIEHLLRGEWAVGSGWLMRARRHLADQPEGVAHGFLAAIEATLARFQGDPEASMSFARRATSIGQRSGQPDLIAMGIHLEGLALIAAGRTNEGMAMLDEAMTSVVASELSDYFTGAVYCNVLEACLDLADLRRATEWSEAARAWTASLPEGSPYPGLCRINRAEVAMLRGAYAEAEEEAARACDELIGFNPIAAAMAFYETGEIRRRVGDAAGAEDAFERAHDLGFDPQPGLALLRLAQGRAEAAQAALRVAVAGRPGRPPRRVRLLAAQVEVALAVADLETARRASEEMDAIAGGVATPFIDAIAGQARGAVRLAEGDVPGALLMLRDACSIWQALRLPYETAHARMLCGIALRRAGADEDAELELRAALSALQRLGAADTERVAELLSQPQPQPQPLPRGLTEREVQILRLVATGKRNRDIAGELVISEHTVARHLQNIFAKLGVSSRAAATAFAFEHDLA